MRQLIARLLTPVCSKLLYYLHNRSTFPLSREEIRSFEISFSQNGEDLMVWNTFRYLNICKGVYLDAGAYDPLDLSNTLIFYKRGWRGINIDFSEAKIERFRRLRPDDHNVVACLSDATRDVQVAHYAATNTDRIMPPGTSDYISLLGEKPTSTHPMRTATLSDIIAASPFEPKEIDYVNIDCEGHDLEVLRGLDLNRCRPSVIAIEGWTAEERRMQGEYLEPFGYRLNQFHSLVSLYGRDDD
jgi:FkbM family methyltransferase